MNVQFKEIPKSKTKNTSQVALKAFFKIVEEEWKLDAKDQKILLGISADSTFYKLKKEKNGALSLDTFERISYILGIYKNLQILLPNPSAAAEWITRPNHASLFGGRSALERMRSGLVADLYVVRQYLDSERGLWS